MNQVVRLNHSFEFRAGGVFTCTPRWKSPYGAEGRYLKLYLPFEGEAEIRSEVRGWWTMRPGKLYVIPAYLPHANRCSNLMRLAWLHVIPREPSLAKVLFSLQDVIELPGFGNDTEVKALLKAGEVLGENPNAPNLDLFDKSFEVALNLQAYLLRLTAQCLPFAKEKAEGMVLDMTRYLESGLEAPLDMEAMSRYFDRSEGFLRKHFREQVGETPQKYHERHRVLRAQQLLWESKIQIAGVARACGWEDPLYFSKVFKSRTGLSPREYRKRTLQP